MPKPGRRLLLYGLRAMTGESQHLPSETLDRETGSGGTLPVFPEEPCSEPYQIAGVKLRDRFFKAGIFPKALEPALPDLDSKQSYALGSYATIMPGAERIESDREWAVLHILTLQALLHLAVQHQSEISELMDVSGNAFGKLVLHLGEQESLPAQGIDDLSRELLEVGFRRG